MSLDPTLRRHAIGASELASVMGWDPRRKPFQLWLEKLGLVDRPPTNYRMRKGKFLERLLIEEEYTNLTGRKVIYWDKSEHDPERPEMVITADGLCPDEPRGVEAKVVAYDQRRQWDDGPPPHVYLQCLWAMSFYRYKVWDVIAAIADDDPEVWTLELDEDLEKVCHREVVNFRESYLLPEKQPPLDGSAASAIWLQRKYPQHRRPDVRPATTEEIRLLEEYTRVRIDFATAQKRRKELEDLLKDAVGFGEGISWDAGKFLWRKTRDGHWMDYKSMAIALAYNFIKDETKRKTLEESYLRPKPGMRRITFSHKSVPIEIEEAA